MKLLPHLIQLLKLDRFQCRGLTSGEIELCRSVYADLIDYDRVKVMNHPFLPWQPQHIFMAPQGYIHIRNAHFSVDFSQENLSYQSIFIHEMAHVYQHQQGIPVLFKGAILQTAFYLSMGKYNPYHYQLKAHKAFHEYNIEQQGDIAKDIFLGKIPNIILKSKHDDSTDARWDS